MMTNLVTSFKIYAPSLKEGVLFLYLSLISLFAQNPIYQLRLHLNDSAFLQLPIILKKDSITIPAYSSVNKNTSFLKKDNDSIRFSISIYENICLLKKQNQTDYQGIWIKYSANNNSYKIKCSISSLFKYNVDINKMQSFPHKWKFNILSKNKTYTAYGTFQFFNDNILPHLSGSIATPYGDLGHLGGFIKNDSVFLSVFNGSFATYLVGKLFYSTQQKLDSIQGYIYYGSWSVEKFSAIPVSDISMKNQIQLNEIFNPTSFILNVHWKDIYNQPITIEKNKPLILLLMGTWCPNCTDENKLFTEWYLQLSFKVQIIALAVERTNNSNKAIQLLQNYKTKLNIPYPIVLLSEKGNQAPFEIFPQLIKIPAFPTTIYFNKELKPVFATMGFNGPATNELYLQTQQHIKDIIQQLQ